MKMSSLRRTSSTVSVELLSPEHHHVVNQALQNILSTDLAELTMAQLVDGLPLASSGWDARGSFLVGDHPLTAHENLCDGSLEQTRAFRDAFDSSRLQFDSSVCTFFTKNSWLS
jgi:hypothetical protein